MLEETKYFQTQTQTLRLRGCDCSLTKLGSGGQDKNPWDKLHLPPGTQGNATS